MIALVVILGLGTMPDPPVTLETWSQAVPLSEPAEDDPEPLCGDTEEVEGDGR